MLIKHNSPQISQNPIFAIAFVCMFSLLVSTSAWAQQFPYLQYDTKISTSFSVPMETDLTLLTQSDLVTMLPYEEVISHSISFTEEGKLLKEKEVLSVSGHDVKSHEIGNRTIITESGIKTFKANGELLAETPFDESSTEWFLQEEAERKEVIGYPCSDPFIHLDEELSTLPSNQVVYYGNTISVEWYEGSSTTYFPDRMTVVETFLDDEGEEVQIRDVYQHLNDGTVAMSSNTIRTSRITYAGVKIIEEKRTEYSNYVIQRKNDDMPRKFSQATSYGEVQLFPNPVHDVLLLRGVTSSGELTITIFNISGQQIESLSRDGDQGQIYIPVSQLEKGMYFLSIRDDHGWSDNASFIKH